MTSKIQTDIIEDTLPAWWVETTLGDVAAKIISWGTPSTQREDFYGWNIPWIRTQEVNFNYIYETKIKITEAGLSWSSARWIPKDTVIIAMYGNSAWRVAYSKIEATTNQACCNFVAESKKANSLFIFFNLLSRYKEIESMSNGAAQQNLSVGVLKALKISLPSPLEQQAIASVLSSFDDKIELLREQNKILEQLGQTIFQEWFGKYGVDEELPEGWRFGNLGEVIENFDSQRIPIASDKREKWIYPYYGATWINDYVEDYIFDWIYTLLGEDGSVIKDNGKPFTQYVWWKIWVNNHAHVLQGKDWFSTELIKIILDHTNITPYVNWAVQLKINQTNMNSIPIVIPIKEKLDEINTLIQPIFSKIRSNIEQIQSISKARDELLPRLMNGELRVDNLIS